jgi:hypothetical protein
MMLSAQMQMILACTHASINECLYVHCMMIKQNHCGVCEDTTVSFIVKLKKALKNIVFN